MKMSADDYYSVREAAKVLDIHEVTLLGWLKRYDIPSFKRGRRRLIHKEDLSRLKRGPEMTETVRDSVAVRTNLEDIYNEVYKLLRQRPEPVFAKAAPLFKSLFEVIYDRRVDAASDLLKQLQKTLVRFDKVRETYDSGKESYDQNFWRYR